MKHSGFFYLLAVLLAVTCGQQLQNSPGGPPGETNELLRRREEFLRQQQVTGKQAHPSRRPPSPHTPQDTRQLTQIQEEIKRSEELIQREMARHRQLQLQQLSLNQKFRPTTPTEGIPQAPPQVVVPQTPQPPREFIPQTPQVIPQAPQVVVPPPSREVAHPAQRVAAAPPPPPRHQVGQPTSLRHVADDAEDALFRKQAENAHYTFSSSVNDSINDNTQVREETRDGLKVQGLYAYSDGFYKRTIHYEADQDGYRVVKETAEPIGEGPFLNSRGSAEVSSNISGVGSQYQITVADIQSFNSPAPQNTRS